MKKRPQGLGMHSNYLLDKKKGNFCYRKCLLLTKFFVICTRFQRVPLFLLKLGEMLEWLKRHAWKACKPRKGFAGSNPALSAYPLEAVKISK